LVASPGPRKHGTRRATNPAPQSVTSPFPGPTKRSLDPRRQSDSNKVAPWRILLVDRTGPDMAELSDADLLDRFAGGDGDALERLLARHEIPLFHFLVGVLGNHHLAEDALQETFVRPLEKLDD